MVRRIVLILLLGAVLGSGCERVAKEVVEPQSDYLLLGYDVLTTPGRTVTLRARLQKGKLLRDQEGEEIRFRLDGELRGRGRTDNGGFASVAFTPPRVGDYELQVEWSPQGRGPSSAIRARLLVACRPADAPMVVTDIDRTLAATRKRDFVGGEAMPLPGAADAMKRIAKQRTVVYLTHRPDYLGRKTKQWLARHGFPRAPLFLSRARQFLLGSEKFKSRALSEIRKDFTGPGIGVGDKVSDARAYRTNGLKPVLILHIDADADAGDLRELADDLDKLDDSVQVVTHWRDVEKIILAGATFPRAAAQKHLRDRAAAPDKRR